MAGPQWTTGLWTTSLVAAQFGIAWLVAARAWYVWLPCAYIVGATIDHALWVLIHECAHNLVSYRRTINRLTALTANLPLVVPAAMSFCKYHLLHHRHMGNLDLDADIAGPTESGLVGRSSLAKTLWLAVMSLVLGAVRPARLRKVPRVDSWTIVNLVVQTAAMVALVQWLGPGLLSTSATTTSTTTW